MGKADEREELAVIALRNMKEEEFAGFVDYFVPDYAREIEMNYKRSREEAKQAAKAEIADDLPEGVNTKNHVLLCIVSPDQFPGQTLGYLWYKRNSTELSAFIYDFYIMPEYRNRGYGKMSMGLLEKQLEREGVHEIKLRVAYTNKKAIKLYTELGLYITGLNLSKRLGTHEAN